MSLVSRKSLDNDSDSESETEYQLPSNIEFEFVDTASAGTANNDNGNDNKHAEQTVKPYQQRQQQQEQQEQQEQQQNIKEGLGEEEMEVEADEFFFPLFAAETTPPTSSTAEEASPATNESDNKTKNDTVGTPAPAPTPLMKISLKEVNVEDELDKLAHQQQRPSSYYFAQYTDLQLLEFQQAAISFDDIFKNTFDNRYKTTTANAKNYNSKGLDFFSIGGKYTCRKVIDLNECNNQVEAELKIAQRKQKRRPGLKNRRNRILAKQNGRERKRRDKQVELMKQKVVLQKKKRGGKKNKKKGGAAGSVGVAQQEKPKFRTE